MMFSTLNPNLKMNQIGIRWSGTRKCSQRYGIDHFCQGYFSAIQPSEMLSKYLLKYLSKYLLKYILEYFSKYLLKYILKCISNYLPIMEFTVEA